MKNFQTATSITDFEKMAATVSNMVDGENVVHHAAKFVGQTSSQWKRDFCSAHLGRFSRVRIYRQLMGDLKCNKNEYYYVPNPF